MRLALYARYSSDRQSDRSIDDQVALCRRHAAELGAAEVVEVYADYAISGASAVTRPGLQQLLADARAGRFEAVLAEALDRISRDQEDIAAIAKRLRFAGIQLLTVTEGEITSLHVGLKGTMNALFLEDLAHKVRRGLTGRVAQGRSAGGLGYGYRVDRRRDADGERIRGHREIVPEQAEVIREIYRRYAAGESPRAIVADLNGRGVLAPRGGTWRVSSVIGNKARGNGILANPLYRGELVWNRLRMIKDPETGKRISRLNPKSEWQITPAPELRIVDQGLWQAAQDRRAVYSSHSGGRSNRPKRLLSGLLVCGGCGGAYILARAGRYGCAARRDAGTCDQGRTITAVELERRVLEAISSKMLDPDRIEIFVREYQAERRRLAQQSAGELRRLEKRLGDLTGEGKRLVDRICAGTDDDLSNERLMEIDVLRKELKRRIAAERAESQVTKLHPDLARQYRDAVAELGALLESQEPARHEAANLLRSLIDRVVVIAGPGRGEVELEVHGSLATVLTGAVTNGAPLQQDHRVLTALVAGEGLEPPTRGL